ncbi:MAG TPA: ribonuclease catalytic domain-containing protein [Burkholderiaceae bacterium]
MTHVLFEEDGGFKAGTVLSEAGASLQVEHASGKRGKVKGAHVLMRYDSPSPAELLAQAQAVAREIDVDFLWECAPQDEFGFEELAREYFGDAPSAAQRAGLLSRLHEAPVYFYRKGRGRYRPAPPETLKLALAALERREREAQEIERMSRALAQGELPERVGAIAVDLLVRPDKQGVEFRAVARACELVHKTPERLLMEVGAFESTRALHMRRFEQEYFPGGTGFAPAIAQARAGAAEPLAGSLPPAECDAFSIDDSSTTEIDDALSVVALPDGGLRVGVHIAAPAIAIDRDAPLDLAARERMSTVYMPGEKITMLPAAVVAEYSLDAGCERPALSLYADLDADGVTIRNLFSRLERVRISHNLRHDQLESVVTEAALADADAELPCGDALRALWRFALALGGGRERVRGKPEPRFRTDFTFVVEGERVSIVQRRRDAPLDRIVAEMMILANSEWGALLARHGVPGVYRSQQAGRVRMSTHALPHDGLGVAQYVWSTSPLRRYVDLTNQRQLISVLSGERPPFAANDAGLFAIISAFEARHAAYAEFQTRMERYWCLRWIAQRQLARAEAVVVRDDLVRLGDAPLYFRMPDLPPTQPGRRIMVDIVATDEVDLSVQARYVGPAATPAPDRAEDFVDEPGDDVADEAEFAEQG